MKAAIIVDSVAYLPQELVSLDNVFEIKLSVNFCDGTQMPDTSEPEALKDFYDRLEKESQLPTTSQPVIGEYYDLLEAIIAKGYDTVYSIHLSSGISGTFQSAVMAAKEYEDKLKVYCIDSLSASVVQENIVRQCLVLLEAGEPAEQIAQKLTWLADQSTVYLVVENLNNLVKGGRLSATAAMLGSILQIRPLLYFDKEGKIVLFEKIRTQKKVVKRWHELVAQGLAQFPQGIEVGLAHGDALSEIQEIGEGIQAAYPQCHCFISGLGPVVGTHTGRGAKGLAIIPRLSNYPNK